MKQKQHKKRTALLTGLLTLCTLWMGWGQGLEDFTLSNATASYLDGSFNGNGGITWTYGHSRNEDTYPIDGNGLMLRRASDSYLEATIPNGVGDFTFEYRKAFTGTTERQLEVLVNGLQIGTTPPFGTISGEETTVHVFNASVNEPGSVTIRIKNIGTTSTNRQTVLDNISWTAFSGSDPLLTATPTTLTNFEYIEGNGPSASQSVDVSGINLDPAAGDINVAAPANYEVSLDDNTFADDVDIAYTAGEFTDETIYVRLKSSLTENSYNGNITISGGDATDITVAVDGEVTPIPQPELLTNPTSLSGLNYMDGNGPSSAQLFELSGVALNNSDVTLTAPADFEISEDDITYSNNITLTAYDGTPTDIYVRLQDGLAENTYSGDITISGGGMAGNITVALSGEVTPFIDQYAGVGVFELVTSLAELEDGYYVVANETSEFLMTNGRSGSATTGHFVSDDLILDANDNVVNPATDRVWYIEANGAGYTIYNDDIEKYVGWISGNAASIEDNVSDISRWTFIYQDDKFTVNNVATPVRQLSYNSGDPRFAAYGNDGQQELQFYKYVEVNDPILSVNPATLVNLSYTEGNGPSASQSVDVSGINLDPAAGDINVAAPANFEVSLDDNTFADDVDIAYTAGEFTDETVYVRLKSGLTENTYNGNITISGGDAADITVAVDGEVTPIPQPELLANPTGLSGLNYMDGNGPSAAQQFELSGVALDNSNVTLTAPADFEISEDDNTYSSSITLTAYDGTPTDIYVRLQSGLAEDTYSGDITISGGGITGNITVALSGEVTPVVIGTIETFDNSNATASYNDSSFVGNGGITWAYVESRDANNDANGSGIDLPALMLRRASDDSKITSEPIPGGIGDFSVKLYKGFTGSGNRQVELFINGVSQGTSSPFDDYNEHIFAVSGINISGNVVIEIRNITSNQIIIDDIAWTSYATSTPTLSVIPTTLSGLNYIEGSGPSVSQSFEVSGLNLDTTDVTASVAVSSDFELSADDVTYGDTVTLTAFDGTATTIYARLKAGLLANNYTDDVAIAGGGATAISVTLEGDVFEPFDLPYFNGLRNQTDWDQAQLDGFTFTNESFETGTGGYVRLIGIGSNITTPTIDFTNYDIIKVSFDLTTYGGDAGQELTVYVSDDDGVSYTPLGSLAVPSSYETFTEYIDVSGSVSTIGRIKFEMSNGSNSIRFRDLDMDTYSGYVYSGGLWSPSDPLTTATPADDILIVDGTAVLNADFEINNITVANSATLAVENILTVQGDIENNGAIVFVSTSEANTAQFDTFNGTITGNGTVTTERFIPARRAFRFLSSAVTTTSSINANWQEGVNNPDVNTNLNPNPGFGTHISGSATGDNGFDATGSGNPSLFGFANTTQTWTTISNTDINTLTAGAPYRLMVRGDRGIDLSSNSSPATDTRLRATGQLHTGTYTNTTMGQNPDDFNLVGNPYQAAIDMEAVLASSTNLNENAFFVWDPTQGVRGAYVAVDIADGGSSNPSSDANQYLQPGQAAFVTTLNAGAATYTVEEHHKAVSESGLEVFNILAEIDLRLYNQTAWSNDEKPADGLRIKFKNDGSNAVDSYDILKLPNLDENIATLNNGHVLAIESRSMPVHEDVIPLFINQHRDENYVFTATLNHIDQVDVYLRDYFTQDEIALENDTQNIITFSVDENIPESIATDRFEIFFKEKLVGLDDHNHQNIALYPNPSEGAFYLSVSNGEQAVQVRIVNMVGQVIYEQTHTTNANGTVYVTANQAQNGVYLVYVSTNDGTPSIIRWINQ